MSLIPTISINGTIIFSFDNAKNTTRVGNKEITMSDMAKFTKINDLVIL